MTVITPQPMQVIEQTVMQEVLPVQHVTQVQDRIVEVPVDRYVVVCLSLSVCHCLSVLVCLPL